MLDAVNRVISGWFADGDVLEGAGIPGSEESLVGLLPYRAYDAESGLYVNTGSVGFMLEASPLVATPEEAIRHLTAAFSDNMPDGSSLQVMLWASPRIASYIQGWHDERQNAGPVYADLARRRLQYFEGAAWTAPTPGSRNLLRDFRVFVAGSLPGSFEKRQLVVRAMRRAVKTSLEATGLAVRGLEPDGFLSIMDEWLNPSRADARPDTQWRSIDPLNHQLSGALDVYPERLLMDGYPEAWAGWQNSQLLGSAWSDFQRVPCPFLISFGFTVGSETADQTRATLKSTRATQRAGSDIARFLPMIREQAQEWRHVNQKIQEGHKLARCFYQVIVYAPEGQGDEAEQIVRSIWRGNGWRLGRDRYMALQSFLAAMPFMLAEGMTKELTRLGRTKTLLTGACANLAPVQGEWKGMSAPLMLFTGRRGRHRWSGHRR